MNQLSTATCMNAETFTDTAARVSSIIAFHLPLLSRAVNCQKPFFLFLLLNSIFIPQVNNYFVEGF